MDSKSKIDISPDDFTTVKSILAKYVPNYEVWAFGSRVRGNARKYSDLDLAIICEQTLNFDIYANLKDAFSESDLPFKVDIVDWASIDENFKNIIKEKYVVIQDESSS